MSSTEHRAFVEQTEGGGWVGGCRWCRTSFIEIDQGRAESWVSGHDSAVACQRDVARSQPPTFAPTGPNAAMTLLDFRELADATDNWFPDGEILVPADRAPLLYVFTPPTEEGWQRELLGVLHLDNGGTIEDMRGRGETFVGGSSVD